LALQEAPPAYELRFLIHYNGTLVHYDGIFFHCEGGLSCRTNLGFVFNNSAATYSKKKKLKKDTFKMAKKNIICALLKYSPNCPDCAGKERERETGTTF